MAVISMIAASAEFFKPTAVRPEGGKWGWFFSILWDINNNNLGIQIYWLIFAAFFLIAYFRVKGD
ncbi:hypothetical protein [Pseudacidovorax intermedius]|uniref:hypothetical protein n=1 Tax=Pseudacidovorax intermedius TaxID=433924 RepID=UPI0012DE8B36|nr:hypothetical protein [Pseudacidovorax intermedius]